MFDGRRALFTLPRREEEWGLIRERGIGGERKEKDWERNRNMQGNVNHFAE